MSIRNKTLQAPLVVLFILPGALRQTPAAAAPPPPPPALESPTGATPIHSPVGAPAHRHHLSDRLTHSDCPAAAGRARPAIPSYGTPAAAARRQSPAPPTPPSTKARTKPEMASGSKPPSLVKLPKYKVRTVTVFLWLSEDAAGWGAELRAAGGFLARARAAFESRGAFICGAPLRCWIYSCVIRRGRRSGPAFAVFVAGEASRSPRRPPHPTHSTPDPLPGFPVQTLRVATQPLDLFLGPPGPALVAAARRLEALAHASGVPMLSLGGVEDAAYLPWIPVGLCVLWRLLCAACWGGGASRFLGLMRF
jgi:hypothetical protein